MVVTHLVAVTGIQTIVGLLMPQRQQLPAIFLPPSLPQQAVRSTQSTSVAVASSLVSISGGSRSVKAVSLYSSTRPVAQYIANTLAPSNSYVNRNLHK